jgi:hypothetical protein
VTTETTGPRTYGGLRRPSSPGIGPLKLYPTVGLMGGIGVCMILMLMIGFFQALGLAVVWCLVASPSVLTKNQRPLYSEWFRNHRHRSAARRGRLVYRSGLVGATADGRRRLPGLLAPLEVWSCSADGLGRPFALVEIPGARQWAVVFRVDPDGGAMIDMDARDLKVAKWGELLALVGQTGGVRQVAAVIETQPDTGALLRAHVKRLIDPDAPAFAKAVMTASADELPRDVASTVGYVAITYTEKELGVKGSRRERAMGAADGIGRRMPELTAALAQSGASRARPLDTYALTRRINEGYNPISVVPNAELVAAGEPVEIPWEECGPTAADETATSYWHDSGVSRVWEAMKMPTGVFNDQVLRDLIGPNVDVPRKRVTLIYYPVDAADAAEVLDRDIKTALNRAQRRKGPVHAHDEVGLQVARQAAAEEARGAGVAQLSVLVTATVLNEEDDPEGTKEDLRTAATAVERTARARRIRLAPVTGGQAAAFAAGLGVGICLPDLSVVPEHLRQNI